MNSSIDSASRCPFHDLQTSSLPRMGPPAFVENAVSPALKKLNTPDQRNVAILVERLNKIAGAISSMEKVSSSSNLFDALCTATERFKTALKAVSATDWALGLSDSELLVQRGGQRFKGRKNELHALFARVTIEPNTIDFSRLSASERKLLSSLLLLCLRGAPLEEANRLQDETGILWRLAKSLAVIETLDGRSHFYGDDAEFLRKISRFPEIEAETLLRTAFIKTVAVEGTRMPMYMPLVQATPGQEILEEIGRRISGRLACNIPTPEFIPPVVSALGVTPVLNAILFEMWDVLFDEGIIIHRNNAGPFTKNDLIRGWMLVGGMPFFCSCKVEECDSGLSINVIQSPMPSGPKEQSRSREWRRTTGYLDQQASHLPQKIYQFRKNVLCAENQSEETLTEKHLTALTESARMLQNRLLNHNVEAAIKGTQLGTTTLQPGWSLAYDTDREGDGRSFLNNPAHAMAGVQTMLRAPVGPNRFSQIRIWRERADIKAQYTYADVVTFNAYHQWIEAVLEGLHE